MCIQSVQSVGVNIFVFEAGLKRSLNHSERCERDTSSRGGKIKSDKNWHFPLLIGFPLKLSFPSIFPFANFSAQLEETLRDGIIYVLRTIRLVNVITHLEFESGGVIGILGCSNYHIMRKIYLLGRTGYLLGRKCRQILAKKI